MKIRWRDMFYLSNAAAELSYLWPSVRNEIKEVATSSLTEFNGKPAIGRLIELIDGARNRQVR